MKKTSKTIFNKIFFVLLLGLLLLTPFSVYGRNTGHSAFQNIEFENSSVKLLVDMTTYEKQKAHQNLKEWRFFGWTVGVINKNADCKYTAETIFSKANNTKTPFTFTYEMTENTKIETSISLDGTIASKVKGKVKAVELGLDTTIRGQIGRKKTTTRNEETKMTIIIQPNTKITMKVTGNAEMSNGVGRYYFLGICFKKGEWEYIDVLDECYELIEERI